MNEVQQDKAKILREKVGKETLREYPRLEIWRLKAAP